MRTALISILFLSSLFLLACSQPAPQQPVKWDGKVIDVLNAQDAADVLSHLTPIRSIPPEEKKAHDQGCAAAGHGEAFVLDIDGAAFCLPTQSEAHSFASLYGRQELFCSCYDQVPDHVEGSKIYCRVGEHKKA